MVSDAQIVRFLNIAQRKLAFETDILLTCATASTVASQEVYSVPTDMLHVVAVYINRSGTKQKLRHISVNQRDPRGSPGTPQFYYVWGRNVSGSNSYVIGLNPIPADSGTSDLEIYYKQQPVTMVNDSQAPEVFTPVRDALISYACWKVFARDHTASLPLADRYRSEWEEWLRKIKEYINPLSHDTPTLIQDTAGYTVVWN